MKQAKFQTLNFLLYDEVLSQKSESEFLKVVFLPRWTLLNVSLKE